MQRIGGLALFLPVPLVLFLFTRLPLGPWLSLGLGIVLTLSHRLYARPFALARAGRKCLWCGGEAAAGAADLTLEEPLGRTRWRACPGPHDGSLRRTLGWAAAHARFLAVGILGALAAFLALAVAAASGHVPELAQSDAVAALRLGVAVTVLPFGWLGPVQGSAARAAERLPFPVHIQALIGTAWVLWLFRLVGLWWLAAGLGHVAGRLGA